jgi:drug/metabolite transporter (DMT)-like permease
MMSPGTSRQQRAALPGIVQGAIYMTAAALCFSLMNVLVRGLSASFDPLQIAFFRNLFALVFMLPWLLRVGFKGLRTKRLHLHLWRSVAALGAMMSWFYAIALLPLAEAVSLNFTVPLFATAGAALFLGEVVRARRWCATIVGFLGVLVIVRPGFAALDPAMALPILAAVFMATSTLMVKSLSRSETPGAIVLYMNLILTPLSLIPALLVWRSPDWPALGLLALVGLLAVGAHLAMTRAYTKADASAVVPFDYARLPFVAVLAYLIFGQVPDLWTWVGAAVIVASAVYIVRREARIAGGGPAGQAARERS